MLVGEPTVGSRNPSRRMFLAVAVAACLACGGGGGSDAESDADGDVAPPPELRVEIVNVSTRNAYLDACLHCSTAFELWRTDGTPEQIVRPTVLSCRCDDCDASACMGMADGPYAWIELPPGATLAYAWDGRRFDHVPGGCTGTGVGCLRAASAPPGSYEVRVAYSLDALGSADLACPVDGAAPWEIVPYQDVASLANCVRTCSGVRCPALGPESAATASFAWPDDRTVRVELGEY